MCKEVWMWEVVMFLWCWELMWGLLTPMNDCHSNANLHGTLISFILVKVKHFWCWCKMAYLLIITIWFRNWKLFEIHIILCIHVVRNMGRFTYSKCKMASVKQFAYFDMRSCGGAHCWVVPISRTTQAFHSFSELTWMIKDHFWRRKHGIFLCIPFFKHYNLASKIFFNQTPPPFKNASPMFQDPRIN